MKSMRAANSVLGVNYCYLHAGVATLYQGDLARSAAYLGEARRMAEENFGADSGLKAIADVLSGALSFWRSGAPEVPLEEYRRSTDHVLGYDGWFEVFAAGLDVRFHMALAAGRADELQEIIAEGQALVMDRGLYRLSLIVQGQRLSIALHDRATAAARMLGLGLQDALPLGCWRVALAGGD
jgi:LuxR family maltose regulon positive regulatory protein